MGPPQVFTFEQFVTWLRTQPGPQPYKSALEGKPDHPWFRLPRLEIDDNLVDFSAVVTKCLKGSPASDKELSHILAMAKVIAQVRHRPPISVAFIGPQAAGKSLLLCALFDLDGLSLTDSDGRACTSAVIRHMKYDESEDGADKFHGLIKFLDAKKLEAMFRELCRHYYNYHHANEDSDDENEPEAEFSNSQDTIDALKDTAHDVFIALWGSKEKFDKSWSAPKFKSGEFVRLCRLKFEEAISRENIDNQGVAYKLGTDQKELLKKLRTFISQVDGERCLWPLVDNVLVQFNHLLLQQNLEIIDLPGVGDTNKQRARHAEEVRDRVHREVVVCDVARMETDDNFIKQARAAIDRHGAANVQLVATKIDVLNENQLSQYSGEPYDTIKRLQLEADEALAEVEEGADMDQLQTKDLLSKYKAYLLRCMMQFKVASRAERLSQKVGPKLQGRSTAQIPPIIHSSAFMYMQWTTKRKITFVGQPALSPEESGIIQLRKELMLLPADQNLEDYEKHIHCELPAFIEKANRTINQTDREGGFMPIAEDFERMAQKFITRLLEQLKSSFQKISEKSMARIKSDVPTFKSQIETKLVEDWMTMKFYAFNRALKGRGIVPKGITRAKGLENGRNWNQELADVLAPGISKWYNAHVQNMEPMEAALRFAVAQLNKHTMTTIANAEANGITIDKAKAKWDNYGEQIEAKMMVLMTEVGKAEKRSLEWATMKFGRDDNLVSSITDPWYDDILDAAPGLRPPVPGAKTQKKQYMKPGRFQFQKNRMKSHFIDSKEDFVDRAFATFQARFDQAMKTLLDEHFTGVTQVLSNFATHLRGRAPLDYVMTEEGRLIRADLERLIPVLEAKADHLRALLPKRIKTEGESAAKTDKYPVDIKDESANFDVIYERLAKQRKNEQATKRGVRSTEEPRLKRIKHETY